MQSNYKNLDEVSISVYVTNFLETMTPNDLWKLCERHEAVADVFIPRKLFTIVRGFAFVQFLKNKECIHVVEDFVFCSIS